MKVSTICINRLYFILSLTQKVEKYDTYAIEKPKRMVYTRGFQTL